MSMGLVTGGASAVQHFAVGESMRDPVSYYRSHAVGLTVRGTMAKAEGRETKWTVGRTLASSDLVRRRLGPKPECERLGAIIACCWQPTYVIGYANRSNELS